MKRSHFRRDIKSGSQRRKQMRGSFAAVVMAATALVVPAVGMPVGAEPDATLLVPNLVPGRPGFIGTEKIGAIARTPVGVMVAGCNLDERIEQGAQQCLRFEGIVSNPGAGPFEVRWDVLAQAEQQRATQRVWRSDGSFEDFDAGRFTFHPSHAHFHVQGLLEQRLWAADESGEKTGAAPVRVTRKLGFCLIDGVVVAEDAGPRRYDERCLVPSEGTQQVMGVSAGWSDVYFPSTPGNFIEIAGLAVGRYVLETVIDPDGLFVESDETDNVRLDPIQLCPASFDPLSETDARQPCGAFIADGSLALAFGPDPTRTTGVISPEGCEIEPGEPRGTLAPPPIGGRCHSALAMATGATHAEFSSAPFVDAFALGGEAALVLHFVDPANPGASNVQDRYVEFQLHELTAGGETRSLGSGQLAVRQTDGTNRFLFELDPSVVSAGSRVRFRFQQLDVTSYGARYLFGGASYGHAGLTLMTGHFDK